MNVLHPSIHASLKSLSDQLAITCRYLSDTKFLLNIPFCQEVLTWHLSFAKPGAKHLCPDILVPDADFAPLLRSEKTLPARLCAKDVHQKALTLLFKDLLQW
jgi:hypothetical protein